MIEELEFQYDQIEQSILEKLMSSCEDHMALELIKQLRGVKVLYTALLAALEAKGAVYAETRTATTGTTGAMSSLPPT